MRIPSAAGGGVATGGAAQELRVSETPHLQAPSQQVTDVWSYPFACIVNSTNGGCTRNWLMPAGAPRALFGAVHNDDTFHSCAKGFVQSMKGRTYIQINVQYPAAGPHEVN